MTVAELIEALEYFDKDIPVLLDGSPIYSVAPGFIHPEDEQLPFDLSNDCVIIK